MITAKSSDNSFDSTGSFSSSVDIICNNTGLAASGLYIMRPGSEYCYRLFQSDKDFSDANRTCYRQNGLLVKIDSRSENEFIYNEYFVGGGRRDFWIGLNDQDQEGVFRSV